MARPLPEGVDPTRIEQYLNNDEFTVRCSCAAGHAVTQYRDIVYIFNNILVHISFSVIFLQFSFYSKSLIITPSINPPRISPLELALYFCFLLIYHSLSYLFVYLSVLISFINFIHLLIDFFLSICSALLFI